MFIWTRNVTDRNALTKANVIPQRHCVCGMDLKETTESSLWDAQLSIILPVPIFQRETNFRFFKVATLCLDDRFAHSWNSLNQLHEECLSNSLEGVPTYAEHLLDDFPYSVGQQIPNHLNWVEVGWLWRPGHLNAALHLSPSWSNSPYTALRCVLGHCAVEKQMIVSLNANQMGWHIAAECCGSHAG